MNNITKQHLKEFSKTFNDSPKNILARNAVTTNDFSSIIIDSSIKQKINENTVIITGGLRREFYGSNFKVFNSFYIINKNDISFYDKIKFYQNCDDMFHYKSLEENPQKKFLTFNDEYINFDLKDINFLDFKITVGCFDKNE